MTKLKELTYEQFYELVDYLRLIDGCDNDYILLKRIIRFFPNIDAFSVITLNNILSDLTEDNFNLLDKELEFNPNGDSKSELPDFKEIPLVAANMVYDAAILDLTIAKNRAIKESRDLENIKKFNSNFSNYKKDRDKFFKLNSYIGYDDFLTIEEFLKEDSIAIRKILSYIMVRGHDEYSAFLSNLKIRIESNDRDVIDRLSNI